MFINFLFYNWLLCFVDLFPILRISLYIFFGPWKLLLDLLV
jgi:hypothetical protein